MFAQVQSWRAGDLINVQSIVRAEEDLVNVQSRVRTEGDLINVHSRGRAGGDLVMSTRESELERI